MRNGKVCVRDTRDRMCVNGLSNVLFTGDKKERKREERQRGEMKKNSRTAVSHNLACPSTQSDRETESRTTYAYDGQTASQ